MWIVLAAAAGAGACLLHAFRVNATPLALRLMMTAWVLAPFAVFLLADRTASRWPPLVRGSLRRGSILAAIVTVGVYAIDAVRPFSRRAAAIYVIVPPASLLLVLAMVGIVVVAGRGRSR